MASDTRRKAAASMGTATPGPRSGGGVSHSAASSSPRAVSATPLSPLTKMLRAPPTRDIHLSHKEIAQLDTAGGVVRRAHTPESFQDLNLSAARLGKSIGQKFSALSKPEKESNIAALTKAAADAEHTLFGGDKVKMESHQGKVREWLKRPNGAGFRKLVPKQDELTQSSRTASQIDAMQSHVPSDQYGKDFLYQSARYFSALRAPTTDVRLPLTVGGEARGPVHPSGAPPARKIEGGSSASTGAHQDRSDFINKAGALGLATNPARAMIAMGVAAGQYTYNSFAGPREASNVHGASFATAEHGREAGKALTIRLAAMADVHSAPGVAVQQSPRAAVRAHPGSIVSPIRISGGSGASGTGTGSSAPSTGPAPSSPIRDKLNKRHADVTPKIGSGGSSSGISGTSPAKRPGGITPKIGASPGPVAPPAKRGADVTSKVGAGNPPPRRSARLAEVTPKIGAKK